jgi:hypothetical protein
LFALVALSALILPGSLARAEINVGEVVVEVVKVAGPALIEQLGRATQTGGQSSKAIRIQAPLGESRIVAARQEITIETAHWRSAVHGKVSLMSRVPCDVFYCFEAKNLELCYEPARNLVRVKVPDLEVLTITSHMDRQEKKTSTTWLRFQSANQDTFRQLEAEVAPAVKRKAAETAEDQLPGATKQAKYEFQQTLQQQLRKINSQIVVVVE